MKTLREYATEIGEAMKSQGFWDNPVDERTRLFLIVGELAEAQEADRGNKGLHPHAVKRTQDALKEWQDNPDDAAFYRDSFKTLYEMYIKGSVEEELSDAIIRMLDIAHNDITLFVGARQNIQAKRWADIILDCTFENIVKIGTEDYHEADMYSDSTWRTLGELLFCAAESIIQYDLTTALVQIIAYCELTGIDIKTHVDLKIAYNKTRAKKHGKEY